MVRDEGQEQERGPEPAREGEHRVLRAREAFAASGRHHVAARQGLRDQADHKLPPDETSVSGRSDHIL